MTSKEFFVYTVKDEIPRFKRVIEAMGTEKLDYRPHERQKSALEMCYTFEVEPPMLLAIANSGVLDFAGGAQQPKVASPAEASVSVQTALSSLAAVVETISEDEWLSEAKFVVGDKVMWSSTREKMLWELFLDLVHHRGQISTYIRPMGGKVPSIYGPSGDDDSSGM